jgi:hypothetical protein
MMHMRGTPQTMQSMTDYKDIVKEILFLFFQRRIIKPEVWHKRFDN